jgi:hypothetical protein
MNDVKTQVRAYLDSIATPVTVEEIVAPPIELTGRRGRKHGPLIALAAAAVVAVLGGVSLLSRPAETPQISRGFVEEVVTGSEGDGHYIVGFDIEGNLCAEAGSVFGSHSACGGSDLTVVAFRSDESIAVAGYASMSVGGLTAIFDGDLRRSLELIPIPDRNAYAFGIVELVGDVQFVEIEVMDQTGRIIQRHFPSIGPITD